MRRNEKKVEHNFQTFIGLCVWKKKYKGFIFVFTFSVLCCFCYHVNVNDAMSADRSDELKVMYYLHNCKQMLKAMFGYQFCSLAYFVVEYKQCSFFSTLQGRRNTICFMYMIETCAFFCNFRENINVLKNSLLKMSNSIFIDWKLTKY